MLIYRKLNCVCLSGPSSSGPVKVRLSCPLSFFRWAQEIKNQVTGRHTHTHAHTFCFPSFVLLALFFLFCVLPLCCFVFSACLFRAYAVIFAHLLDFWGVFFAPWFVPGTVFLRGRVFCLGGCV